MEQQINTRNVMTGSVSLAFFLAVYLLHHNSAQGLDCFEKIKWTSMIAAFLSTPFVGFAISSMVLAGYYVFNGHPYQDRSRNRILGWVTSKLPANLQDIVHSRVKGDTLFGFILNAENPIGLIEWGRRKHTSRFLAWNWLLAAIMGGGAGLLVFKKTSWSIQLPDIIFSVFLLLAIFTQLLVGTRAAREIEIAELLWIEEFIHKWESQAPGDTITLRHEAALVEWARSLQTAKERQGHTLQEGTDSEDTASEGAI